MADNVGSSSSTTTSSHNSKITDPTKLAEEFHRIMESMTSTDAQKRNVAENQFASIPHSAKCSLLLTAFLAAQTDEKRLEMLGRLQSHLDLHWTRIFPNSWIDDRMSQMCSALLTALQNDTTNQPVRGQIAHLVAMIVRNRMNDNSDAQNWAELIEYIKMSAYSDYDHHMRSALAIVQEVPNIFATDGDACHVFFEGCLKGDHHRDPSLLSTTIVALVTAHSSPKCTVETREALNSLVVPIISVLDRDASDDGRVPATNELASAFVKLCADCSSVDTKMFAMEVLTSPFETLDAQCLADIRILLGSCISSSNSSARSAALKLYPNMVARGENAQSPLRLLFPVILSMRADYASPSEEEEDYATESYPPLDCLKELANVCPSLFVPHLQSTVNMCRETIDTSFSSQSIVASKKRASCYIILQSVLAQYWPEIMNIFGDGGLVQLCTFLIECSFAQADREIADLMAVFAQQTSTIALMKQFVQYCADLSDAHKSMALEIVRRAPSILDISEVCPFLDRFLSDPTADIRSSAVRAFTAIAKSVEIDRREELGSLMHSVMQTAQTEASLDAFIECLVGLSRCAPELLQSELPSVITICCRMTLGNQHVNIINTEYARGVLNTLCENSSEMIMKHASEQIPLLLEATLLLAVDSDLSDNEWEEGDGGGTWEERQAISPCEASHDAVHPIVIKLVPYSGQALHAIARRTAVDVDWRKRYVSALAWSALGGMCKDLLEIAKITARLVTLIADTQPQVQNVACAALKRMAAFNAPNLQENSHSTVVPALITLLRQTTVPRVAAHAGATLAVFIVHCPQTSTINLESALLEIVEHLQSTYISLLSGDRTILLDETLAPIRMLSMIFPLLVYGNYELVMAPLRGILKEKPHGQFLSIVIRAISCVGMAAGRSRFLEDGMTVLCYVTEHIEALLSMKKAEGFERIFELLGPDTTRFLPSLVPALLAACKTELGPDVDYAREEILRSRTNIAQLMIKYMMVKLRETFEPFVKSVAARALETLRTSNNNTKSDCAWAASILPIVFGAIKNKEGPAVRSLWLSYLSALKAAMRNVADASFLLVRSLLNIMQEMDPKEITDVDMKAIVEMAKEVLQMKKARIEEIMAMPDDEDDKKEILAEMHEIIECGLFAFGRQFVPVVREFMPFLAPFLGGRPWEYDLNQTILSIHPEASKSSDEE